MRAGLLRHRITIEQPVEVQNVYGEPETTWQTLATVWAAKEDLSGSEAFQAATTQAIITTRFTLRYRSGITSKMRVNLDGHLYNIATPVDPDGRMVSLILLCTQVG